MAAASVWRLPVGRVVDAISTTYDVAVTTTGVPLRVDVNVEVTGFRDPAGIVG